jgi:outer membrane protein OmpU
MDNIKKLGLTALAGSMVATSAAALDLSASGSWGLSYTSDKQGNDKGQAWTAGNSVTFSGSGEIDNGWTASMSYELDNDVMDDYSLSLDMGDAGVFKFSEQSSGSGIDIASNVVPAVDTAVYTAVGTDTTAYGQARSAAETGNLGYTLTMDGGLKLSAEYAYGAAGNGDNTYGATYTGIDGMTIAVGAGEINKSDGSGGVESRTVGVKYAWSGFTAGLQLTEVEHGATGTQDEDGTHMGITYNVNDDVSIGYSVQETDFSGTSATEENSGFQASYSLGSISFSGRITKQENSAGTAGSSDEDKHITMSIAF